MTAQHSTDEKRVVLGIGTGRSGSESLGYLLNLQEGAVFSHEFSLFAPNGDRAPRYRPPLAWDAPEQEVLTAFERLADYPGRVVGDIASYWLPHLPVLFKHHPSLRVVSIERNKEGVVRSFMEKTNRRNHWYDHRGEGWEVDPLWDPVFPNYAYEDKAEGIAAYWDEYFKRTAALCDEYPENLRVWPLGALNDQSSFREIMDHLGFAGQELKFPTSRRRNRKKWWTFLRPLRRFWN